MKNRFTHCCKVIIVFCSALFFLYACSKDPDVPVPPQKTEWQLTEVAITLGSGGTHDFEQRHLFRYNKFNKPWVYIEYMDYNPSPPAPSFPHNLGRTDTFYYDHHQRIRTIISTDLWYKGRSSHKKEFLYDAGDRKSTALKYMLDSNKQYVLSDSTVYVYQGNTIMKITYRFGDQQLRTPETARFTAIDTATFTYDNQGNLTKVRAKWLVGKEVQLLDYRNDKNPYRLLRVNALDLEPYAATGSVQSGGLNWEQDFQITMQMPMFSKNTYGLYKTEPVQRPTDGVCRVQYGSLDSMIADIRRADNLTNYDIYQHFEYTSIK